MVIKLPMKKLLWLLSASIVTWGCQSKVAHDSGNDPIAVPTSVVDTPPPVRLWEEDPDYQEDQAGGERVEPVYDSLGRRIVPDKGVQKPTGTGKTPGKGSDPSRVENTLKVEEARRINAEKMRIHDSIQKAKEKPQGAGKMPG